MKTLGFVIIAFSFGCGSKDSADSTAATAATTPATDTNLLTGSVWKLASMTVNGVDLTFAGNAFIEYKNDSSYVYHEAYFSVPSFDYGPCWDVSKGSANVNDSSVISKVSDEVGRDICKGNDSSESTESYVLEDGILTLTLESDGKKLVSTYRKDSSTQSLDYTALSTAVDSKSELTVDKDSDSYIQDKNENDNLKLLLTECDFTKNSVNQYFSSEAMGSGHIIGMDFHIPDLGSWVNNKVTDANDANSCDAPGYRALVTGDLQAAKVSNNFDTLYGCGATCTYTLVSETHDSDNNYTSVSVSWECNNVGVNKLANPSVFGPVIDKHIGKATCTK